MKEVVTKHFRKQRIVRVFLLVNGIMSKMWEQTMLAAGVQVHAMSKGNSKVLRTTRYVKEVVN